MRVLRSRQHTHRAHRVHEGLRRLALRAVAGATAQPVAGTRRTALDAPQAGSRIGGATAQHRRHVGTLGQRQVANAVAAGSDGQRFARLKCQAAPGIDRQGLAILARQAWRKGPGQGHADRRLRCAQLRPQQGHLQCGQAFGLRQQRIGAGQQHRVGRAGQRHADVTMATAAQVLDRDASARIDELDDTAHDEVPLPSRQASRRSVPAAAARSNAS